MQTRTFQIVRALICSKSYFSWHDMSLKGERKFCVICDKDVEIVKVITHGNYEEQILSCDHIGGRINLSLSPESVGEKLEP
jgi:hypothetical protein